MCLVPCLQGTPSLAELKLQYYTLMIRYHMVRTLCWNASSMLDSQTHIWEQTRSTATTTWRCAAHTRPSMRQQPWLRTQRSGRRR